MLFNKRTFLVLRARRKEKKAPCTDDVLEQFGFLSVGYAQSQETFELGGKAMTPLAQTIVTRETCTMQSRSRLNRPIVRPKLFYSHFDRLFCAKLNSYHLFRCIWPKEDPTRYVMFSWRDDREINPFQPRSRWARASRTRFSKLERAFLERISPPLPLRFCRLRLRRARRVRHAILLDEWDMVPLMPVTICSFGSELRVAQLHNFVRDWLWSWKVEWSKRCFHATQSVIVHKIWANCRLLPPATIE